MPSKVERPSLRVSVIIPTYNRASYLREALDSVFGQSLAAWEVIVVDDGSTDNTLEVLNDYDGRVRHVQQVHEGVAAARNRGLELAQGDLIAWLDSDDLWEPDFLASVVPLLEADRGVDGVYSSFSHIDSSGAFVPQSGGRTVPHSALYLELIEDDLIATPSIVVRSRCYQEVGAFDTQFRICEDYDMWLRLASRFTLVGLPRPLVKIRIHEQKTVADVDAFCRYRLALTQKHFGEPVGDPQTWPADRRRAHAFAFRAAAVRCLQNNKTDQGWRYLGKAFSIWPDLLGRLDTFYELACGDQPDGYRGDAGSLDIEANGIRMFNWLDAYFAAESRRMSLRGLAYGNAYLALAMLSDQSGHWSTARRHLLQAIKANPRLLTSSSVLRRLLKLSVGQRLVGFGRSLGAQQRTSPKTYAAGELHESQTGH